MQMLHQLRQAPEQEKVVVVSNSTKCLTEIELLCRAADFPLQRLEGSTPSTKRVEMVQRFNMGYGEQFLFLLSSKAGGVGLNIVGASRLVLFDSDWNPANDLQVGGQVRCCATFCDGLHCRSTCSLRTTSHPHTPLHLDALLRTPSHNTSLT